MIIIGAQYDLSGKALNWKFEDLSPEQLEIWRERHIHGDAQIKALYKQLNNAEIHLTDEQLSKINTNTLIIIGEKDFVYPDLTKVINLHNNLPDSHLWIVPNAGHDAFTGKYEPEFIRNATEFLSGEWQ